MNNKNDLKSKLLELYTDALEHSKPTLKNSSKKDQLKLYPIMQFVKELCIY